MRRISALNDKDNALVHWAKHDYPNEACGVIVDGNLAIKMKNIASDPTAFFAFDMEELIAVYDKYGDIDAVWHSHPGGREEPSTTDLEHHPRNKRLIIVANGKVFDHGIPS